MAPETIETADSRDHACRWCAQPFTAAVPPAGGRRRCLACGVATTHPWPTDRELDAAYGTWYRPPTGRFQGPGDRLIRRTRARLASRVARIAPPGPVLDVGAGDGALVDAFTAAGRDATGLERVGADHPRVRPGSVEEIGGRWAAVTFWHSIEHLRDPRAALDAACHLLEPDGLLVVAVPNAGSLQARVFGNRWFALDLPRHLVHLHPRAIVQRLAEQGMTVTMVSHVRGGQGLFGWLHGIVGALPLHLDLYDAIRRPEARYAGTSRWQTLAALGLAALSLPAAAAAHLLEVALRRGGSIYVEARR